MMINQLHKKQLCDGAICKLSYTYAFEYIDNHKGTTTDPDFTYNTSGC